MLEIVLTLCHFILNFLSGFVLAYPVWGRVLASLYAVNSFIKVTCRKMELVCKG